MNLVDKPLASQLLNVTTNGYFGNPQRFCKVSDALGSREGDLFKDARLSLSC